MTIIQCPHCSTSVMTSNDGVCPSCRLIADSEKALASLAEREAPAIVPGEDGRESDLIELQRLRRKMGYKCIFGAVVFIAASLVIISIAIWLSFVIRRDGQRIGLKMHKPEQAIMLVFAPIGSWLMYVAQRNLHEARKCFAVNARLALLRDTRPSVLYLRSFRDDEGSVGKEKTATKSLRGSYLISLKRYRDEENIVEELCRCVGPVIAIGRPGEPLPDLGAHRMYVSDETWMGVVVGQLRSARLVVLRVGWSHGILWELSQAVRCVSPENLVLWSEPPQSLPPHFKSLLPTVSADSMVASRFIYFDNAWKASSADSLATVLKNKRLFKPDVFAQRVEIAKWVVIALTVMVLSVVAFNYL